MITIKINNNSIKTKKEFTIIEACKQAKVHVPKFCFHKKLQIAGNCRACLVEVKGVIKPLSSCTTPVIENINIYTNTAKAKKAKEHLFEFILINHPLDCPICDQAGECDLQNQSYYYGSDFSRFYHKKKAVTSLNIGPLISSQITRCIQCTRCIRFFNEYTNNSSIGTINRGKNTKVSFFFKKVATSFFSGNVIDLCPVNFITRKIYL